jgi:hypothetical protein
MVARKAVRLAGMASVIVALPALLQAGTLGLAWDASDGAAGYRVHYGTTSGQYTGSKDVGNVTETTLTTLVDCTEWYLAVTAYNGAGESGYSEEVASLPRPTVTGATPAAAMQGSQITLRLSGANYESGATVTTDNPNVFLDGVRVTSCNQIEMVATVEPSAEGVRPAEVGRFALNVRNPSGLSGGLTQAFEVLVNPGRFDINVSADATAGRLDGMDTASLSRLHGNRDADPGYDPDADFNGDGWIDGEDLSYVAASFGLCWSGSAWNLAACPQNLK